MRKRYSTFLALALIPACASNKNDDASQITGTEPTAEQIAVLHALEQESGSAWQIAFDARSRSVLHLEGRLQGALKSGEAPSVAALSFLASHKQLFRMNAPEAELALGRERDDTLGMHHVRFAQRVGGIPVAGAEVFVHFRRDGSLSTVDTTYVPDLASVNLTPAFSTDEALQIATLEFASKRVNFGPGQFWRPPIVELVVFPNNGSPRLAYHVRLHVRSVDPSHMDYMIDASTRVILRKYDNLQTATPTTGSGRTSDNVTVTLQIAQEGTTFSLEDLTRTAKGIRTFTYNNQPDTTCANDLSPDGCLERWINANPKGTLVTSADKDAWDTTGNAKGAAVDAHLYAGYTYDYYKSKFNRDSIDNNGMEIQSNVHFSTSFANAFWDGFGMVYGDGDTIQLRLTTKGYDVIVHELTHGVTEHESKLEYHDQPGAMNESLSDIFAAFAEHVSFPHATNNWWIGEKVAGILLGTKLRDMADPASVPLAAQPDHMTKYNTTTEDNGGVHINSGIPNNAAYLMTMGGTNKTSGMAVSAGIGWEKAEQLWYRAATEYLGATSDFKAAAQATLTAASDLGYTEVNKATVECAWIAVGVITTPSACRTVADDGGTTDAGRGDGGGTMPESGGPIDSAAPEGGPDVIARDVGADVVNDTGRPVPDATFDAAASDATPRADAPSTDVEGPDTAPVPDATSDSAPPVIDAGGSGGGGGSGGASKPSLTTNETTGCGCRVPGERAPTSSMAGVGSALALLLARIRRRARKSQWDRSRTQGIPAGPRTEMTGVRSGSA